MHVALSDDTTMRYWSSAPHKSLAETETYITWNASEEQGHFCWAIAEENDLALGWVILIPKREGVHEIGYILRPDFTGRGLAREAVHAVIAFGFSTLGLRRICADIDPENTASVNLVEAIGFKLEGHFREEWKTHIGVRDSLIYAILARDWFASSISLGPATDDTKS
jgi:RimJ/RimL family protein N-acetyltransferase